MPENLKDKKKCFKCNTVYDKKLKKCKVCQCHAVTYCGQECQLADRSRHEENCVPVMVKEYEGKGLGLVAAKDIKMGELILIDKAAVTDEDFDSCGLDPDVERMLLNQKILKDISMLNHSCSPNAEMGLLDGEKNEESEKRFELRAVKNISKGGEVTIYYPLSPQSCYRAHAFIRESIQEDFGFDCKCVVCLGQVPNQDGIVEKIREAMNHNVFTIREEERTIQDWKRQAIVSENIYDLAKPLYIGRETEKGMFLVSLHQGAVNSGNSVLERKTLDEVKELADKTGLEMMENLYENLKNT